MRICDRYELRETHGMVHQAIDYGERNEGERVLLRTFEHKAAFERTVSDVLLSERSLCLIRSINV